MNKIGKKAENTLTYIKMLIEDNMKWWFYVYEKGVNMTNQELTAHLRLSMTALSLAVEMLDRAKIDDRDINYVIKKVSGESGMSYFLYEAEELLKNAWQLVTLYAIIMWQNWFGY